MIRQLILICLVLSFCNTNVYAADSTFVCSNINQLFAYALKNNPNRKIYTLNTQKASIDYKTANSYLYPTVTGSFAGQDNLILGITPIPGELVGQPGKTIDAQFGKKYVMNTGISISRNFFDWQAAYQAKLAKNSIALNELQTEAYDQGLKQQVAQYYYACIIARAAINISEADLLVADSLKQLAIQRLKEGLTDATAVNQATIDYNTVLQNNVQNHQLLEQSLQSLKLLTGIRQQEPIDLQETLSLNNTGNHFSTLLGADKSLLVYENQIKGAGIQEKIQKSAYLPQLGAGAYLGQQQFRQDFGMSFASKAWNANQYISLNLSLPLFTGFANKNKVKSAEVATRSMLQQYENAQFQSAMNDSLLLIQLSNNEKITKASAENFQLYANNCSLYRLKYLEGLISLDVYLKSFEDYLKAENTHLNNLSALYNNYSVILSRQ
jgi:outer membrane protein TolC